MGRKSRKEGMHVYVQLIPFAVQQKLTQHCKATACIHPVAQSCPTLCDRMDCSTPGSSVPGILQARVLDWVARQILYHCAIWEAPKQQYSSKKHFFKKMKRNRCSDCLGDLADDKKALCGILCYFYLSRFTGLRRQDRHRTCTSFSVKKKKPSAVAHGDNKKPNILAYRIFRERYAKLKKNKVSFQNVCK